MNIALIKYTQIDDIRFVLDIRDGVDRGTSKDSEFVLVKTRKLLRFYRALQQHQPKNILEIGMFEGGSLVMLDKRYDPKKVVGVDVRPDPIEPLENYRKHRKHIRTLYGLSQADPDIPDILREEFPEGIDLIVDDASHQYELTRVVPFVFPALEAGRTLRDRRLVVVAQAAVSGTRAPLVRKTGADESRHGTSHQHARQREDGSCNGARRSGGR